MVLVLVSSSIQFIRNAHAHTWSEVHSSRSKCGWVWPLATVSSSPAQYFVKNGLTMMWNNVLALKWFFGRSASLSIHLYCVTRLKMLVAHIHWRSPHGHLRCTPCGTSWFTGAVQPNTYIYINISIIIIIIIIRCMRIECCRSWIEPTVKIIAWCDPCWCHVSCANENKLGHCSRSPATRIILNVTSKGA